MAGVLPSPCEMVFDSRWPADASRKCAHFGAGNSTVFAFDHVFAANTWLWAVAVRLYYISIRIVPDDA